MSDTPLTDLNAMPIHAIRTMPGGMSNSIVLAWASRHMERQLNARIAALIEVGDKWIPQNSTARAVWESVKETKL